MSAKIVELPSLANIPKTLRTIADEIDAGKFGDVEAGVLTIAGDKLEIFGLGPRADAPMACYLLTSAQVKMTLGLVNAGEDGH